jgi:broad specificity phosphatase PhoE
MYCSAFSTSPLRHRVLACLTDLLVDSSWKNLLPMAHGGVNRVLLIHALGSGLAGFASLEQDAGCINVLDGSTSSLRNYWWDTRLVQ